MLSMTMLDDWLISKADDARLILSLDFGLLIPKSVPKPYLFILTVPRLITELFLLLFCLCFLLHCSYYKLLCISFNWDWEVPFCANLVYLDLYLLSFTYSMNYVFLTNLSGSIKYKISLQDPALH